MEYFQFPAGFCRTVIAMLKNAFALPLGLKTLFCSEHIPFIGRSIVVIYDSHRAQANCLTSSMESQLLDIKTKTTNVQQDIGGIICLHSQDCFNELGPCTIL